MELEFFAVAESVIVDQASNRVSLLNIYENVEADAFPALISPAVALAVLKTRENDSEVDWQALLKLFVPGRAEPFEFRTNVAIGQGTRRHRLIQRIEGVPVFESGTVKFELFINDSRFATHEIEVIGGDANESAVRSDA